MRLPASLRWRVVLAIALLGGALSLLFAGLVVSAVEVLEVEFTSRILGDELDSFMSNHEAHPGALPPTSHALHGYVVTRGAPGGLPPGLEALEPGVTELMLDGRLQHVAVADRGPRRYYLVYDFALFEERERAVYRAVGVVAVVSTALALWLGFWLAGRIIVPVTRLARRVTERAQAGGEPGRFARDFGDDEVGVLARAFDGYVARLDAFVQRERRFTAEASHELRTPLAVMASTVEVLLAEPGLEGATRARLLRLQRGTEAMKATVEALLAMARAEGAQGEEEQIPVARLLDDLAAEHRPLLDGRPVELRLEVEPGAGLTGPAGLLRIVLGNLIRNACSYTAAGSVCVRLAGSRVSIEDTGSGIAPQDQPRVFEQSFRGGNASGAGSGLGLAIVRRICDRRGWRVALTSTPGVGTRVEVDLAPGAA